MGKKLPWFPLYVYDFAQHERVIPMTYEQEGLYLALLRHEWIHGSIPADDAELRGILKAHNPDALAQVKRCFEPTRNDESRLSNPRIEEIRRQQSDLKRRYSEAGRKGGVNSGLRRRSQAEAKLKPGSSHLEANPKQQSRAEQSITEQRTTTATDSVADAPATKGKWLAPYFMAWVEAYHGDPSPKELARFIAPLRKKHGDPAVILAWESYLGQTGAQYASPARFAKTYGTWSGTAPPVVGRKLSQHQKNEAVLRDLFEKADRKEPNGK